MGGAVTNLAAVKHELADYDPAVIRGTVLDREEVDRQIELYRTRDAEARRQIVGLQPARAEVILAGACIVRTVMDKLGQTVTDRQRPGAAPRGDRRAVRDLDGDPGPLRTTCLGQRHGGPAIGRLRLPGLLHRPADARVGSRAVGRTTGIAGDDGGRRVWLRRAGGPDRARVHPGPAAGDDRRDPRRLPA